MLTAKRSLLFTPQLGQESRSSHKRLTELKLHYGHHSGNTSVQQTYQAAVELFLSWASKLESNCSLRASHIIALIM